MEGDPQQPICPLEPDPSSLSSVQNTQLVAQGQDLKLQSLQLNEEYPILCRNLSVLASSAE